MGNALVAWKLLLSIAIYVSLGMATVLESDIQADAKAATFTFIASGTLFVSLVPGSGFLNSVVTAFLSFCGAFAAALAAWHWLDPLNRDIGLLWIVVGVVAFVMAFALLTFLLASLWSSRFQNSS